MADINKPNMSFPLATSYNERGMDGYAATVTNSLDQRKINSLYESVTNSLSGRPTLYLVKRPGAVRLGSSSYGSASDTPYLTVPTQAWVVSMNGNSTKVSDSSTSTTIMTAANSYPVFVDVTRISGTITVVLQVYLTTPTYRVFYASAIGSWTEIVDADFTSLTLIGKMEHIDGFPFIMDSQSRIYNGDLNSLASWSPTNFITKEIEQDVPRGLARCGNILLAFGAETVEGFRNAGRANGSPLAPIKELSQRIGLCPDWADQRGFISATAPALQNGTRNYYAALGQRIYFIGRTSISGHSVGLFTFNGQTFEKVSTPAIDRILGGNSGATCTNICALNVQGKQGIAITLGLPTDATQRWLMFIPDWKDWFEWTSTVFQAENNGLTHCGISGAASANRLYWFDGNDSWTDAGTSYDRVHQFRLPDQGSNRKFMRWCGLEGTMERTAATTESVQFSDDDGQTWSAARTIDRTADVQNIYRCGSYKQRMVRLTNSSNTEGRLEKFLARVE